MQIPISIKVKQNTEIPLVRVNVECNCMYPFETLIQPFLRMASIVEEMEGLYVDQDFPNESIQNNCVRFTVFFRNMEKSNLFCKRLSLEF